MYSFYIYYYLYSCFLGLNFGVVLVVLLDDCVFMPIRETPILPCCPASACACTVLGSSTTCLLYLLSELNFVDNKPWSLLRPTYQVDQLEPTYHA